MDYEKSSFLTLMAQNYFMIPFSFFKFYSSLIFLINSWKKGLAS